MNITRNIIADLYPVYQSGEASADTRALVEEYLRGDPEFARRLWESAQAVLPEAAPAALPREHEIETLARTRQLVRRRGGLLGLAIFFTMLPFSSVFERGHFTFIVCRDAPQLALVSWLAAAATWAAFLRTRHRLRNSGILGSTRALRRSLKFGRQS